MTSETHCAYSALARLNLDHGNEKLQFSFGNYKSVAMTVSVPTLCLFLQFSKISVWRGSRCSCVSCSVAASGQSRGSAATDLHPGAGRAGPGSEPPLPDSQAQPGGSRAPQFPWTGKAVIDLVSVQGRNLQ